MNICLLLKTNKKDVFASNIFKNVLILFLSCMVWISILGFNGANAQTALETNLSGLPALNIVNSDGESGTTYSLSLQILALMTALTILPSLVLGMTSFTRVIIVLSI